MKIRVLFFAQLQEIFGTSERIIEMPQGAKAGDCLRLLFGESKNTTLASIQIRPAVNERFVNDEQTLENNDVLALIPPVSGG